MATNTELGDEVNYGGSYKQGRISFSSMILLVIFVSAAALIVAAIVWRPWFADDATLVGAQPTATAAADTAAQQAPSDTPVPGAPQGP